MKKCRIQRSTIHGKGIVLTRDIKRNEVIFVFCGDEITYTGGAWHLNRNWLQVGYAKWINPRPNTLGNYLNHSCSPTAGVRGKNRIVAIRDLKAGQEVTIDYALSETYPLWHMRCRCGSKNCRKVIKPYQDLSDQRKARFISYTSRYILDMKMHLSWRDYLTHK